MLLLFSIGITNAQKSQKQHVLNEINGEMKNFVSFMGTLLITALQSVALSAFCWCVQWVLNHVGLSDMEATMGKFLWGSACFFIILFLLYGATTALTMYRMHKDPIFKDAHLRTGMSWKDYQRLKNK